MPHVPGRSGRVAAVAPHRLTELGFVAQQDVHPAMTTRLIRLEDQR